MKGKSNPTAEIVSHFQILASVTLWLEFLYTHGPEEPKEKNEPFELETDYNLLNRSMQAERLVTGPCGWLYMFSKGLACFGWFFRQCFF